MKPFRPPPPVNRDLPFHVVGRRTSKLSCGAIVPDTLQYSALFAAAATSDTDRISAPPIERPPSAAHGAPGSTVGVGVALGVSVNVALGLAVGVAVAVGVSLGRVVGDAVGVSGPLGVAVALPVGEGGAIVLAAVGLGDGSRAGRSSSEHPEANKAQTIKKRIPYALPVLSVPASGGVECMRMPT